MNFIEFNLKTVTPVFNSGSNQEKAELRPSSLKGSLRYWYRAALAIKEVKKLHDLENEIFGSTEAASTFSIRIKNINKINNNKKNKSRERLVPHKNFTAPAIKKEVPFKVILTTKNNDCTKKIKESFLLAILLGGIGQRSRRGFGSLKNADKKFKSKNEFLKQIKKLLEKISYQQYINKDNKLTMVGSNKYDYPVIKEVIIGKSYNRDKILKKTGNATHDHRDYAIGNGSPRMASPVYVTIDEINDKFYPIITKLEAVYPERNYNVRNSEKKIDKFIKELR